jgi:hypothetical protein
MSNLGIFSLLVVGRDMPHPFARTEKVVQPPADRATPVVQQGEPGSRVERIDPIIEQTPEKRRMS